MDGYEGWMIRCMEGVWNHEWKGRRRRDRHSQEVGAGVLRLRAVRAGTVRWQGCEGEDEAAER